MGVLITRHEHAELLYLQRLLLTRGGFTDLHAWGRAAADGWRAFIGGDTAGIILPVEEGIRAVWTGGEDEVVDDVLRHPPRVIEPLTIRVSTDRGIPAMLIGYKRGGTGGIPASRRRMARLLTPCFARAARSWASDPLAGPPADETRDRTGLLFFDDDGSFRRADATARDLLRDPDRGPPVRRISEHLARELGARPAQVLFAHATTRAVRIRVTAVRTKGVQAPCAVAVSLQKRDDRIPLRLDVRRNHGLTPRQMEVALLMARRLSHKEIARKLGIRPNTTRRHERDVLTRLGVRRRHQVLAALTRLDTRETNHDPTS